MTKDEKRSYNRKRMLNGYDPAKLAEIDCLIVEIAKEYCYIKDLPLVYGKARRVSGVFKSHYGLFVSETYIWDRLEEIEEANIGCEE